METTDHSAEVAKIRKRMLQHRMSAGLKQKEMADKLGIPFQTYRQYETGKRQPGLLAIDGLRARMDKLQ